MTGAMSLLGDMGIKYHAGEGKGWRPTHLWLKFEVDTYLGSAELEELGVEKGLRLREEIFEASSGSEMPARTLLATAPFLSFLRWVAPGGSCHL